MLDRDQGLESAARFIAGASGSWSTGKVRAIPELAFLHEGQLIVPYDSVAFLDLGDEGARLGGNMPVRVDLATGDRVFCSLDEVFDYMDLGFLEETDGR